VHPFVAVATRTRVWLPLTTVPRTRAQPVFVYIPPDGELRGGAWVVIDPTINADQVGASFPPARPPVLVLLHVSGCCHESYVSLCQMEMYTDSSARGGILEPPGIVEIKYRRDQLLHTMARLDPEIASLQMQLGTAPEKDRVLLASQLKRRQELLLPFYTRVAEHYADLHDVPVRMTNKGCIHGIVDWRHARAFFHARLRRRLAEAAVVRLMRAADPESDFAACKAQLAETLRAHFGSAPEAGARPGSEADDDRRVAALVAENHRVADYLEGAVDGEQAARHPLAEQLQARSPPPFFPPVLTGHVSSQSPY